ncbi:MAG: hypothetical protein LBN96_01720 [Desulfovibrio sp.]|jgi:hypothetical protein|nr:hypothetical protein [Desulfovibrio sp.]
MDNAVKRFLLVVCAVVLLFSQHNTIKAAECNQKEAKSIIKSIIDNDIATREDGGITIWYTWQRGWWSMPEEQRYNFAAGLGGAEHCIKPGVAVRIRAAGEEVARSGISGTKLHKR